MDVLKWTLTIFFSLRTSLRIVYYTPDSTISIVDDFLSSVTSLLRRLSRRKLIAYMVCRGSSDIGEENSD